MDNWLITVPVKAGEEADMDSLIEGIIGLLEHGEGVHYHGGAMVQNISSLNDEEADTIVRDARKRARES